MVALLVRTHVLTLFQSTLLTALWNALHRMYESVRTFTDSIQQAVFQAGIDSKGLLWALMQMLSIATPVEISEPHSEGASHAILLPSHTDDAYSCTSFGYVGMREP